MRSRNGLKTQYLTLNIKFYCGNSLNKVEGRIWAGGGGECILRESFFMFVVCLMNPLKEWHVHA